MINKFWESFEEGLSGKLIQYLLGPSLVFWAGGFLVWGYHVGFLRVLTELNRLAPLFLATILTLVVVVIIGSAELLQAFHFPLLRVLEGYWIFPLTLFRPFLTKLQRSRMARMEKQWRELADRPYETFTAQERERYAHLEQQLHYVPANPQDAMPTTLGNILRSAETIPHYKYGLDPVVCWPRLWLVLPDSAKNELSAAQARLSQAVIWWFWGALFMVWLVVTWWSLPISLIIVWAAYLKALHAARIYADLIEATFDLYRWNVYRQLGWDTPRNNIEEPGIGQQLTAYLWRGQSNAVIQFPVDKPKVGE
ncbi:MAG TPA: hypothetical protein VFS61_09345 [Anaerolineales bacterium]|nr:hypothetical protein [Anaerolineales bacterium]